jgi:hypothetical protein
VNGRSSWDQPEDNAGEETLTAYMPTLQLGEDTASSALNVALNLLPGLGGAMSAAFTSGSPDTVNDVYNISADARTKITAWDIWMIRPH